MLLAPDECTYQSQDALLIKSEAIPKHIAIIMDGNRRWAKKQGLLAKIGHWRGAEAIDRIMNHASALGVEILTVYAFSTENWGRPQDEVDALMDLFKTYLIRKTPIMLKKGVKLETIGDLSRFPQDLQQVLIQSKEVTKDCKNIQLVLALNYGARDEIRRAISKIVQDVQQSTLQIEAISEAVISSYLDTAKWKDPDLLIRTSGESRLSNFLLWQLSYAEVYITEVCWPDFDEKHLKSAISEYQRRNRRFGE